MHEPYKGYDGSRAVRRRFPPGAGAAEIRQRLLDARASCATNSRCARRCGGPARRATLKAGEYRFDRPMSAVEVVDKLARGDVYARRITFPEGLTIRGDGRRSTRSRGLRHARATSSRRRGTPR